MENGKVDKYTAMSKTVGLTCSIATKLILENKITREGVYGPFHSDIYNSLYEEMIKEDIIKPYTVQTRVPGPKL